MEQRFLNHATDSLARAIAEKVEKDIDGFIRDMVYEVNYDLSKLDPDHTSFGENGFDPQDFVSEERREAMKGLPTHHYLCLEKTKRARPGKTARDRAKGKIR